MVSTHSTWNEVEKREDRESTWGERDNREGERRRGKGEMRGITQQYSKVQ